MIIRSSRHNGLKRFVETNQAKGIGTELIDKVRKILAALILADDLNEFVRDAPPGWRVHRMTGKRKSTWSVAVTGNWRLTFEEHEGLISNLDMEEYL